MKNVYRVSLRLTREELQQIDRQAAGLGISRSELIRALLSGDAPTPTPTIADGDASDAMGAMGAIKGALSDMRGEISAMRAEINAAFDELLKKLSELIAVPSFTEFRARMIAQGIKSRPGESTLDYVVRIAQAYYAAYGIWPDPDDHDRFGRMDEGDRARFPRHPPK